MLTRTYISKFNTIISGDTLNTGLNPVSELVYGANLSRMIIYFDHSKIKKMVEDGIFPQMDKLKHYLKITNAGSLDFSKIHCGEISSISDNTKIRASSFDLIFFLVPQEWDNGKGFDYSKNFFNQGYYANNCGGTQQDSSKLLSYDGSNWYQSRNGYNWPEEGIYTNTTLSKEYDKFAVNESNIIIGRQHFDIGNENINLDITEIVNSFINGTLENYGIGIAYSPMLENSKSEIENYTGFLTHKTNSFFEPYVETIYNDSISDDRANFLLDKNNRLYLYCNINNKLENLDETPTCSINDHEYEVKQFSTGIYYIDVKFSSNEVPTNMMFYDVWDNLKFKGEKINPVELEFVTKNSNFVGIGNSIVDNNRLVPTIYGINYDEKIERGDVRKLVIYLKSSFKRNLIELADDIFFRLYIKDGEREIDIIPFEKVNKSFLENYTIIDTEMLIPEKYYVDIKINYSQEMIIHHNVLSFKISENLNNKYN